MNGQSLLAPKTDARNRPVWEADTCLMLSARVQGGRDSKRSVAGALPLNAMLRHARRNLPQSCVRSASSQFTDLWAVGVVARTPHS